MPGCRSRRSRPKTHGCPDLEQVNLLLVSAVRARWHGQDDGCWRFGDFVFASDYDHTSNLTRARQARWCESLDTETALVGQLRVLREQRVVP